MKLMDDENDRMREEAVRAYTSDILEVWWGKTAKELKIRIILKGLPAETVTGNIRIKV
jgi:hypothetical protein